MKLLKKLASLFRHSLQTRLYFVLLISFISTGLVSSYLFLQAAREFEQQTTQVMHRELAQHVANKYPFFDGNKLNYKVVKKAFTELMVLGPNFEFYILDSEGQVAAFSGENQIVKRKHVDTAPISQFLTSKQLSHTPAILGVDPRSEDGEKVFSAAKISHLEHFSGYVYVIIGSQIHDETSQALLQNRVLQWGLCLFVIGLTAALLVTVWMTGFITRPLKRLTSHVQPLIQYGFEQEQISDEKLQTNLSQWQDKENEIHQLGTAFSKIITKLSDQYTKVVALDNARLELLSHISHDLRTPLASMLGYLETWEMQKDHVSREQSDQSIVIAQKNAARIATLIEQLFELAHLESGSVTMREEPVAIAELVQDVLIKFQLQADRKQITLDVEPKDPNLIIHADIEKLDRVFSNLINNGIRHTPDGGKITVNLTAFEGGVNVEVADTGIGISEEELTKIFEPHFKADNSVRDNTAHGGLGLAIVKKLLDLHGTGIYAKSQPNIGTSFYFKLAHDAND